MNLLLLEASELTMPDTVCLEGRRARHLREILDVQPGSRVRTGVIDGALGEGEVVRVAADSITLRCVFQDTAPPAAKDVLLMALPRPKVLARALEHAASLGFGKIVIFRSRRVVKSHFDSHVLQPESLRAHLIAGLEQARRTHLPHLQLFRRFRPFIEDELESVATSSNRYLADPDAARPLCGEDLSNAPLTLVLGPEGGLIPHEVEAFSTRGFHVVNAGPHPLRVEAALSYISGQLMVLRERRALQNVSSSTLTLRAATATS